MVTEVVNYVKIAIVLELSAKSAFSHYHLTSMKSTLERVGGL
jgi:hypothetical protein